MSILPDNLTDGLEEANARAAFLTAAVLAISERPGPSPDISKTAWTGLFFWTLDLEELVSHLNAMLQREDEKP